MDGIDHNYLVISQGSSTNHLIQIPWEAVHTVVQLSLLWAPSHMTAKSSLWALTKWTKWLFLTPMLCAGETGFQNLKSEPTLYSHFLIWEFLCQFIYQSHMISWSGQSITVFPASRTSSCLKSLRWTIFFVQEKAWPGLAGFRRYAFLLKELLWPFLQHAAGIGLTRNTIFTST